MTKSKDLFTNTISCLIPGWLTNLFLKHSVPKVFVPFYHIISDTKPAHVKYLYPVVSTKRFILDLEYVLRRFKPIDLKEFIEISKNNNTPKKPVIHFTFDDGFREFNEYIAPILLSKGIPATCFLNTGFIDNKDLMYRCKASLMIDTLHNSKEGSSIWKNFHEFIDAYKLPHTYYRKFLLSISYRDKDLLDDMADKIELDFKQYLSKEQPYLTTEQIKELINKGFTFGAHSVDHPNYLFLSEEEQLKQTRDSIESVCTIFKLHYKAFAFPFTDFGLNNSFFNAIAQNNIADITFGTAGIKKDTAINNFQRFSGETEKMNLEQIVSGELKYLMFLSVFGKSKIRRE